VDAAQGRPAEAPDGAPTQSRTGESLFSGYELGEDIIRQIMLEMLRFRTSGLEILIFNDCLETPMEAAQALCGILRSPRLNRSVPNFIVVALRVAR
jgi:hypothetical protein